MPWRIGTTDYLLAGESYPILLSMSGNDVQLSDGTCINSAREYFRVSADGEVHERYCGPWTTTLEDELYVSDIHIVSGSTFRRIFYIERLWRERRVEETILHDGLTPVQPVELPFDAKGIIRRYKAAHPQRQ
jgi:hypothetical protein